MSSIAMTIRGWLSSGPYYVRISRSWVTVRDVATGREWKDEPLVGVERTPDGQKKVSAVGAVARGKGLEVINPFDHPRSIVNDFITGEKLLQYAFACVSTGKFLRPAPIVVIHVIEPLEAGLTDVERRALQEMASGAGAREIHVWEGRILSDAEIQQGVHKPAGPGNVS